MAILGYIRVSHSTEGNLETQRAALAAAGADRIFQDGDTSGAIAPAKRPGWRELMAELAEGDVVLVNDLSRLGRSFSSTLRAIEAVKKRGAVFRSLLDGVSTGQGPAGDLLLNVLGAVAQFERALVAERSRQGVARAKSEGKVLGRPSVLSPDQQAAVRRRLADGESVRSLAALLDVSRDTIRRAK